jgi:transposase
MTRRGSPILLAHGLIRGSFVPPTPIQALRDLTRTRKQLVGEIARHTLRLQKTLEDANLKLTHVVSDVLEVSDRAILTALIAGETDPTGLADLTTGRLKASRAQLIAALHGRVTAHHRFLLDLHLRQIEALETAARKLEGHVGETLAPFSHCGRPTDHDARRQHDRRARADRRDRRRHDPLSDGRPSGPVGRSVSPPR